LDPRQRRGMPRLYGDGYFIVGGVGVYMEQSGIFILFNTHGPFDHFSPDAFTIVPLSVHLEGPAVISQHHLVALPGSQDRSPLAAVLGDNSEFVSDGATGGDINPINIIIIPGTPVIPSIFPGNKVF